MRRTGWVLERLTEKCPRLLLLEREQMKEILPNLYRHSPKSLVQDEHFGS